MHCISLGKQRISSVLGGLDASFQQITGACAPQLCVSIGCLERMVEARKCWQGFAVSASHGWTQQSTCRTAIQVQALPMSLMSLVHFTHKAGNVENNRLQMRDTHM